MNVEVVVVSSSFPYGAGEGFMAADLEALAARGLRLGVVPLWPQGAHNGWRPPSGVKSFELARHRASPAESWRWMRQTSRTWMKPDPSAQRTGGVFHRLRRETIASALATPLFHIVESTGAGHIHAYWASGPATAAMPAARRARVTWSATAHAGDIFGNPLLAVKGESATFIRAISDAGRREIISRGVPAAKVPLIHIGMPLPSEIAQTVDREPTIGLCPAMLIARKGHDVLLQSIAKLRDEGIVVSVDLAGDGPLRNSIATSIAELGLQSQVRLLGTVSRESILGSYASSAYDFVVVPTSGTGAEAEGVPAALIEAAAFGLPCVSTNQGGVRDLLPEGYPSLVTPGNVEELAEAIGALATSQKERRIAGETMRSQAEAEFDATCTGAALASALRDSIDASPGRL